MSGGPQRSNSRQERRPRQPRTMAPLLGLVRGGGRRPWTSSATSQPGSSTGKSGKVWRGIRALRAADRFRLWLVFVLSPGELSFFERWALANDAAYGALLRRYRGAAGSEDQENLLLRLRAAVGLCDEEGAGAQGPNQGGPLDDDGLSA